MTTDQESQLPEDTAVDPVTARDGTADVWEATRAGIVTPAGGTAPWQRPAPETMLGANWQRIQAMFVDDPRASVTEAAELVTQAVESFIATIQDRERALRSTWEGSGSWDGNGGGTDTEKLRTAFREYRAFYQKISQL